jgi:hypothetical protein
VLKGATVALYFAPELALGNVYVFYAGVLVLMTRGVPGAVAFAALTKATPSLIGLWFVFRRDWVQTLKLAYTTTAIVVVSAAADPDAWQAWLNLLLTRGGDRSPLSMLFLVAAVVAVALAVRLGQPAWLAPAMVLAIPFFGGGFTPLAVMAAVPRLRQRSSPPPVSSEAVAPYDTSGVSDSRPGASQASFAR